MSVHRRHRSYFKLQADNDNVPLLGPTSAATTKHPIKKLISRIWKRNPKKTKKQDQDDSEENRRQEIYKWLRKVRICLYEMKLRLTVKVVQI